MTYEFEGQQPVVVLKQSNVCGAKGHSREVERCKIVQLLR